MKNGAKLIHLLSFAVFLGSIAVYTIISLMIEGAQPPEIAFGRKIISSGTAWLTIPSMWSAAASGLAMIFLHRDRLWEKWVMLKLSIAILIIINTFIFVNPAIGQILSLTSAMKENIQMSPEYRSAYFTESVAGSVNVALILVVAFLGVARPNPNVVRFKNAPPCPPSHIL